MNVQELRIGNYIHNNVECFPLKAKDLIFLLTGDNEHYAVPIPLNEKWLRDLGFSNEVDSEVGFDMEGLDLLVYFHDDISVEIVPDKLGLKNSFIVSLYQDGVDEEGELCSMGICELPYEELYVHQLQNIVSSIYGKELKYEA